MAAVTASRSRRRRLSRGARRVAIWTLAAVSIAGAGGAVALTRLPIGQEFIEQGAAHALAATGALGLVVTDVQVSGRETTDPATVMAALAARRGTPILAVSPSRAKQQLEALPWVRSAVIERRLPGTLYVRLVERKPLAVWQHGGRHELIDRDGAVIPVRDLSRFSALPTVVGDDAAKHAAALIDILAREPDLAPRVSAAVRVGDRRWNLRIDGAIEVMLPDKDQAGAWSQLARLERTSGLLKRDVQTVDMRLPDRLVLRINAPQPGKEATPAKKAKPAGKPA